jgi:hypothetical protein
VRFFHCTWRDRKKCVGIDVGVLTYAHDTDGTVIGSLDLTDEREWLEWEQRNHGEGPYLSRGRMSVRNWWWMI